MLKMKDVYSAIEGLDNGSDLMGVLKGELDEVKKRRAEAGEYKAKYSELSEMVEKLKPYEKLVEAGVDPDTAMSKIEEGKKSMSTIEKMELRLKGIESDLDKERKEKEKMSQQQRQTSLLETFKGKLNNVKPNYRDKLLRVDLNDGILTTDDEGKPVAKIDGRYLSVDEYVEKFKSDNPEVIIKENGAGSSDNGSSNYTGKYSKQDLAKMSDQELQKIGMGID